MNTGVWTEKLEAILQSAVDAIITIDANAIIESANPATTRLFGYSEKELVGRNVNMLMPEPYHSEHDRYVRHHLETGERRMIGVGREIEGRRKDGTVFPMHLSVSRFQVSGETFFTGMLHDLTTQKFAESAMAQFGKMIENSLNEIYVCELDRLLFTSVNRGAQRNLGYTMDELRAMTPLDLKTDFTPESYKALIEPLVSGQKDRVKFETSHRRKNGSRYPVEVNLELSTAVDPPVLIAHIRDLTEAKKHEKQQQLLLAEINHRVKNTLAVVSGIATETARTSKSLPAFSDSFPARLQALGRAHTLLTETNWSETPFRRLAEEILAPYVQDGSERIKYNGPSIDLKPKVALTFSMILHELVTNAVKHGALSVPEGNILIAWKVISASPARLRLHWQESGVTGPVPEKNPGFGSRMIEATARHELGGSVSVTSGATGIAYEFEFPMDKSGISAREHRQTVTKGGTL